MKSYGSAIRLSYKMPVVKKNKMVQIFLYSGDEFVSEIDLFPTNSSPDINKERPYARINDISLFADIKDMGNQIQVFISAVLPKDANRDCLVNQCRLGFSEYSIYLQDDNGNIYKDESMAIFDSSIDNYVLPSDGSLDDYKAFYESLIMYRSYHFFYFEVPNDVSKFKIIIPKIIYSSKGKENIELFGPWEIEMSR